MRLNTPIHSRHVITGARPGSRLFLLFWSEVTCAATSHLCICAQPFWGRIFNDEPLPLLSAPKDSKTNQKHLAKLLNMGPPEDKLLHMSTDRTEDLRWIVNLSWHGMRDGLWSWRLKKSSSRRTSGETPQTLGVDRVPNALIVRRPPSGYSFAVWFRCRGRWLDMV